MKEKFDNGAYGLYSRRIGDNHRVPVGRIDRSDCRMMQGKSSVNHLTVSQERKDNKTMAMTDPCSTALSIIIVNDLTIQRHNDSMTTWPI
jgi:hypothetical protein